MKPLYLLAIFPVIGFFGGLSFANRVEPYVLGLPFLFFWIILWVALTSVIMAVIYRFDPANKEEL
ncbi:DUF3311 domain-containing protein [Metabacillus sp. KIGAM252]|uniref:DUF3311 domain-containing protein n=1 Tax=Metabacillus flavus TaxID=2823519 RepID=A0ABS5LDE4_9BACI|nr:DUF3311 domain-containing protein [Metabacillus flavus]MBS2968750.1 DUF3311 domain-containing protein [Metabacillus flavus]